MTSGMKKVFIGSKKKKKKKWCESPTYLNLWGFPNHKFLLLQTAPIRQAAASQMFSDSMKTKAAQGLVMNSDVILTVQATLRDPLCVKTLHSAKTPRCKLSLVHFYMLLFSPLFLWFFFFWWYFRNICKKFSNIFFLKPFKRNNLIAKCAK